MVNIKKHTTKWHHKKSMYIYLFQLHIKSQTDTKFYYSILLSCYKSWIKYQTTCF